MTIRFICSCGKHLKARDEMASRRSFCPRCGKPVGIPSLQPTARGTPIAPMSHLDRLKTKRAVPRAEIEAVLTAPAPPVIADEPPQPERPVAIAGRPLDFSLVRLVLGRKHFRRQPAWRLETHWWECLLFPFRAWPLVLGLALALSLFTGITALTLPLVLDLPRQANGTVVVTLLCTCWTMVALILVCFVVGFLECTLSSALVGEVGKIRWTAEDIRLAVRNTGRWAVCFLAGPIVPATMALIFWLKSGDLATVDWFILAELTAVTVGYWMLAVTAAGKGDRLRDANPARVMAVAEQIGMVGVTFLVMIALLTLLELAGILVALEWLHSQPFQGIPLLLGCWLAGMFGFTFLLRMLGVFCYERRWPEAAPEPAEGTEEEAVADEAPSHGSHD